MGKLIISMFMFNSYVELPEGTVDFTSIYTCFYLLSAAGRRSSTEQTLWRSQNLVGLGSVPDSWTWVLHKEMAH